MYEKLIDDFSKVPERPARDESFISICKYPHYERVASSIMSFFLDTQREHKLHDLFVKSLLESAGFDASKYPNDFHSETEVQTKKGNFIDILLYNDRRNIVIENKIYAWLYNDLDDYYETASDVQKENPIGIVLSLYQQSENNTKYKYVTYEQLFIYIKKNIGFYIQNANKKYIPFLFDFIENIEDLTRSDTMDNDFIKFVKNNSDEVISLANKLDELRKDFRSTVNQVLQLTGDKIKDKNVKLWAYRELPAIIDDAVVDYYPADIKDAVIAMDSIISLDGWSFGLWIRSNNSGKDIKIEDIAKKSNLKGNMNEGRFITDKTFPVDTKAEDVANYISEIINQL